jgi:hypothetical protein
MADKVKRVIDRLLRANMQPTRKSDDVVDVMTGGSSFLVTAGDDGRFSVSIGATPARTTRVAGSEDEAVRIIKGWR